MAPSCPPIRSRVALSNQQQPLAEGFNEPGVNVLVDPLEPEPILGGMLSKIAISTHNAIPTSNEGSIKTDPVPGSGIVLPGGISIYFLDVPPHTQIPMHRTSSTDYVIVQDGTLTMLSPTSPFAVEDSKGKYDVTETVARTGDVVLQRGAMHAMANRTDDWVRLLCVVIDAVPVPVEAEGKTKKLEELWLQ